jgi:hypothetical protein
MLGVTFRHMLGTQPRFLTTNSQLVSLQVVTSTNHASIATLSFSTSFCPYQTSSLLQQQPHMDQDTKYKKGKTKRPANKSPNPDADDGLAQETGRATTINTKKWTESARSESQASDWDEYKVHTMSRKVEQHDKPAITNAEPIQRISSGAKEGIVEAFVGLSNVKSEPDLNDDGDIKVVSDTQGGLSVSALIRHSSSSLGSLRSRKLLQSRLRTASLSLVARSNKSFCLALIPPLSFPLHRWAGAMLSTL